MQDLIGFHWTSLTFIVPVGIEFTFLSHIMAFSHVAKVRVVYKHTKLPSSLYQALEQSHTICYYKALQNVLFPSLCSTMVGSAYDYCSRWLWLTEPTKDLSIYTPNNQSTILLDFRRYTYPPQPINVS